MFWYCVCNAYVKIQSSLYNQILISCQTKSNKKYQNNTILDHLKTWIWNMYRVITNWCITVTSLGKNPANYSWTVTSTGDQWTVLPSKNLCKASVSSITVSILVAPVYKLHEHERTDPPRRAGAAGVACALNYHHPDAQLSYKLLNKLLSSPERVRYQYLLWIINIYNNEK